MSLFSTRIILITILSRHLIFRVLKFESIFHFVFVRFISISKQARVELIVSFRGAV